MPALIASSGSEDLGCYGTLGRTDVLLSGAGDERMTERAAPTDATAARGGALGLLIGRVGGVAGALVVGQVITGLTYLLAARTITPATLGTIATCVAIGAVGATVFDAGLTALTVREVAAHAMTWTEARALVRSKRRLSLLLIVPTGAACLLLAPSPAAGVLLGGVGIAMWEAQTANALLRAQEKFARAATGQLVGRAAGLLVVLVSLLLGGALLALPAGLVVSFAVEALVDRVSLGAPAAAPRRQRDVVHVYRQGLGYGLASLAASAQQLDTPLVALGGGATSAGLYAAAGRLLGPLGFLASSLSLVGAPWLARAKQDPTALRVEERRVAKVAAVLCLAPLLAAAVGPFLIPLLLGDAYATSGAVFVVLAIGSVFSTANQPLAMIVQNRGRQRLVAVAVGIGLGVGLAATYVLAIVGGATWAAVGFTVSQLYILAHLGLTVRRLRTEAAVHQ